MIVQVFADSFVAGVSKFVPFIVELKFFANASEKIIDVRFD
jgi:hypothetical protein